jgi:hypothetical protein
VLNNSSRWKRLHRRQEVDERLERFRVDQPFRLQQTQQQVQDGDRHHGEKDEQVARPSRRKHVDEHGRAADPDGGRDDEEGRKRHRRDQVEEGAGVVRDAVGQKSGPREDQDHPGRLDERFAETGVEEDALRKRGGDQTVELPRQKERR